MEHAPFCLRAFMIRRRVGSAIARSIRSKLCGLAMAETEYEIKIR
jgi:hypothetical protein